jgi:hypothetical protein
MLGSLLNKSIKFTPLLQLTAKEPSPALQVVLVLLLDPTSEIPSYIIWLKIACMFFSSTPADLDALSIASSKS